MGNYVIFEGVGFVVLAHLEGIIGVRPRIIRPFFEWGQLSEAVPVEGNIGESSLYLFGCLLYTSPSPRDRTRSRMPSSA